MTETEPVVIAHISDLHIGSMYFRPDLAEILVDEVNELAPEIVACTGDLTDMGYRGEYEQVAALLRRIVCPNMLVIPGNHDARNVGEVHFEEFFGPRDSELALDGVRLIGLDSSEPDLDIGRIGRERYKWIQERFADPEEFKILAVHHHLVSVPGTGRERNIVYDAGDLLRVLSSEGCDLVLCGHKHVPNVWRLEDLFIVNAGTACSMRLRGREHPCYNIVEVFPGRVRVTLAYPGGPREVVADFRKAHQHVCRWRPVTDFDGEGIA